MKKRTILLLTLIVFITGNLTVNASGENPDTIKYWKNSGIFSLNAAQSSFSNWSAGGQNSIALNGLVNLTANYKKNKSAWDNTFDFGYGMLQRDNGEDKKTWIKTDDKINITSKYGYQASKVWYYTALFNFKTQFTEGYNYLNASEKVKISDFMAPGYLLFSLGMDYKPNDNLSVFISPVTMKSTIVNDKELYEAGAFGVDPGKKLRNEFGAYINAQYKKDEIVKNVNFSTKLDLFTNYLNNPQNIDVNWETLFVLKVNKFISATVSTNLIYDDDTDYIDSEGTNLGPKVQFKEVIGVGFTYKFPGN